ncbi:hypothetical protein GIB67_028562 [Kingdonia uniflora]|uniref:Uncharacterized protein n=1 Tax=Kingdonia uniflora TaxID=39325 RepID=A0A7J7NUY1_9MAGN|nr:hypothetical protein GIB67_028562 [Kingdonia uniflora]
MEYSSSISALSLFSQTKPQTSRALQQQHGLLLLGFSGSKTPLSINKTLFHQSLSPYLGKLQSPFLHIPISNSHKTQCFNAPQSSILRKNAEKIAILLVGSLLFVGLGKFGCKPCLAVPTSVMEEKMDTQSGKSDDEEMWLKLLEKNPSDVEALKVVLYGKMRRGKTKESIEYVERLIDIEPDEVEWRLLQALAYEMVGYLSKAKRLFKDILKERPLLLRALHGLVLVMHKNHEGPAAFEMLNKALEVACREKRVTEERNIRILIAQMLVVKGDLEEGLKKFQDLVNDNPRDFRPYLCQAITRPSSLACNSCMVMDLGTTFPAHAQRPVPPRLLPGAKYENRFLLLDLHGPDVRTAGVGQTQIFVGLCCPRNVVELISSHQNLKFGVEVGGPGWLDGLVDGYAGETWAGFRRDFEVHHVLCTCVVRVGGFGPCMESFEAAHGIIYSLLDKKKEAEEQFETYHSLVPHEFPQRGFLDDVLVAAKTESRERFEKAKFSYKK